MLVLIIMLVPTVNAETYESTDNIIPTDIVLTFENYFNSYSFQYFSYDLNNYPCYYAIDPQGNYLNIVTDETGHYAYTGTDENFSVNGSFVYEHKEPIYLVLICVTLLLLFKVISHVF